MRTEQFKETPINPIRQKALGLFEFLKEIVQIRSVVTRDNKDYPDVLWLSEIPRESGCYCAGWPENQNPEDNVWVEIKKQNLPKLPDLPKECVLWVDKTTLRNLDSTPALLESVLNPEWKGKNLSLQMTIENSNPPKEIPQYLQLKDFPDVKLYYSGNHEYISDGLNQNVSTPLLEMNRSMTTQPRNSPFGR